MTHYPGITAVMPTSAHGARRQLCRVAIECFSRQTYPERQLLILNHGEPLFADKNLPDRVTEKTVQRPPTLGELRNLAFDFIHTPYFIAWDDDDWSHPERMERQYAALAHSKRQACVLAAYLTLDLTTGASFVRVGVNRRGQPGALNTILAAITEIRYPPWHRHEDSVFAEFYRERNQLRAIAMNPAMYVRTCHGENVSGRGHILRGAGRLTAKPLSPETLALRNQAAADFQKLAGISVPAWRPPAAAVPKYQARTSRTGRPR
jgi:glycosyltransferase involved in cell wall biosynthesis